MPVQLVTNRYINEGHQADLGLSTVMAGFISLLSIMNASVFFS